MRWLRNLHMPNSKLTTSPLHHFTNYSAKPKSKLIMLETRSARSPVA